MKSRRWRAYALSVLILVGSACVQNAPMDSLSPAGPAARQIDNLFRPVFWMATVVFVLVEGAILAAVFLFRDRPHKREPKQTHGNKRLEIIWTVIPAVILAAIAVPTVATILDLTECDADAMDIDVIGHQWWFEYQYPDADIVTANALVIPAGRQVCLDMTSNDVLHNYWVPKLNGKRYLVPGQQTTLTIEADEPGEFWGQCAEFCGLSHALMRIRVIALDESGFAKWIANQQLPAASPPSSAAIEGMELFATKGCAGCHQITGVNDLAVPVGPNLTHFATRTMFAGATLESTAENLKAWLANPPEIKPGSFMPNLNLTEAEIDSLIAYLENLK